MKYFANATTNERTQTWAKTLPPSPLAASDDYSWCSRSLLLQMHSKIVIKKKTKQEIK